MSVDVCGASEEQFERVFEAVVLHHAIKMRNKHENEEDIDPHAHLGAILWYDPVIDDFLWVVLSQDDMVIATSEINNIVVNSIAPIRDIPISVITTVLLQFGIAHEIWSTDTYIRMAENGVELSARVMFMSSDSENIESANC